jgi:DNA repair exonuclease SbcCD ATPase subunit
MGGPPSQQSPQRPLSPTTPGESSLLQQSLFSLSASGSVYEDCEDDSLPSLPPVVPPSPLSRPSSSLFDDADESRQQSQSQRSHLKNTPLPYLRSRNRQPPVAEVHLDNEEDTFFEDRSLEHRARQTLVHTPDTASTEVQPQEEPSSADVARVHGNALQAIMTLKEEVMKANEKIRAMDRENKTVVKERDELRGRLQGRDSSSQSQLIDLEEQVYRFEGAAETLNAQNEDLEAKVRAAAREKKDFMHKRLAADNRQKTMKTEIDRLKAELETKSEMEMRIKSLEKENENLKKENENFKKEKLELSNRITCLLEDEGSKSMHQKADSEAKDCEIERLTSECNDNVAKIQELETDLKGANEKLNQVTETSKQKIASLEAELQESNDNMKTLRSEFSPRSSKSSLRGPVSPSRRTSNSSISNVRFHTETPADSAGGTLDSNIADRLARIRDSAERANLVRAHKREMARVKAEKEAQIKKLLTDQEEALRKAVKQSGTKMNTRLMELKASLEQEYEEKLEEVETRYRQQISEVRKMNCPWLCICCCVLYFSLLTDLLF